MKSNILLVFLINIFLIQSVAGQSVEITQQVSDSYILDIDGKEYIALTKNALTQVVKQAEINRARIETYEATVGLYETQVSVMDSMIRELSANKPARFSDLNEKIQRQSENIAALRTRNTELLREKERYADIAEYLAGTLPDGSTGGLHPSIIVGIIGGISTILAAIIGNRAGKQKRG